MTDADPDVLVAGETLVDFLPERNGESAPQRRLADVERFVRRPGGAPANVAVALARLGPAPWFWTRVGEDAFGDFLAETLSQHGVPDRFVGRDPLAATALAFVSGEVDDPTFTFYRDGTADTRLEAGTVPDDVLAAVGWSYVGGVALAAEPARSAILDLVDRGRSHGCTVAFDPNTRPELWGEDAVSVADDEEGDSFAGVANHVIERVDLVAASPADLHAAGFEAADPGTLARAVCERGPDTALITLGAGGAVGHATERAPWGPASVRHDGYGVDAVDATGAGDAFVAGAIRSLADGEPLAAALAFANAVAAAATTDRGAMAALPDRTAAEALRDG